MINVVIVEDNKIIREGLSVMLNGTEGFKCTNSYPNCEVFLKDIESLDADVVLMDIGLPGMNGIEGVKKAKQINPDINILMLTVYEESEIVYDALCAGAYGYLVKKTPPSILIEAIKEVYDGGSPMSSRIARQVITSFQNSKVGHAVDSQYNLSIREREVLHHLAEGSNYQEIANELFISVDTVRHHIRNIYKKLQVHSQSEAVAKAIRKKLI